MRNIEVATGLNQVSCFLLWSILEKQPQTHKNSIFLSRSIILLRYYCQKLITWPEKPS